ncbi:Phosphoribosylformylglycinamidine synthase subunit PurL [Thermoflexales bacterium]|nr:Phosphoribosylformylglycinamidine synthase subunit PurL [Thermoflexales bacterium]
MTATPQHCLIVRSQLPRDPRAAGLLDDAHALGLARVTQLEIQELFFIEGDLCPADRQRLAAELLSDPIAQAAEWRSAANDGVIRFLGADRQSRTIETALRPGVTDPVAEQIVRCAHMLGLEAVQRAATGKRFIVYGKLREADLHLLAKRLLANDVIERYAIGPIEPSFPHPAEASGEVDIIPVRDLNDEQLLTVSRDRRTALDLAEMQAVQSYFRAIDRDPTDVEVEMIAQTWSEHCGHKTFKAEIVVSEQSAVFSDQSSVTSHLSPTTDDQPSAINNQRSAISSQPASTVDGILKTYLRAATEQINAPWVRSAFVDNAGIIDFDDEYEVSFKVETHNHPSAIEPFGGANTGVGGVIRDVLGVSAKPIAATDVLCFGPQDFDPKKLPEGVLHPRRIQSGVVAGVQDYGNKIGIPTVNGAILYDDGYTANPLVFCGCVGLAPKDSHPREPHPGDRVIVLGGRTGRDGLRGATFSSMTMDAQTGEVSGASVQIGDPITEKGLIEVTVRARDLKLYTAITDCGAGGLSSAVGEMSSSCGGEVDLKRVTLKYPGLAPWEIWLSEAQERMVLAVPESNVPQLQAICDTFDVQLTDIGVFAASGHIVVRYGDHVVLDLANEFLHHGIPRRSLEAVVSRQSSAFSSQWSVVSHYTDFNATLLALLASPNIASKSSVIRIYDHEVQGGTVVKPLTGVMNDGPSDGCVLKPIGTQGTRGIVLANGINPELGKRDAYAMAVNVIDEAIRNAVAVGADPDRIALLDNFCWGDPLRPETLGSLIEAARGCYDAAIAYGTPFISGKDSLNNEYLGSDGLRHAIPPTLLISAIGLIDDVNQAVTMDAKEAGHVVYLLKADSGMQIAEAAPAMYRALHRAMTSELVRACHDVSEGGLAVSAAEMCIGGRLGMSLTIEADDPTLALFGEGNGRLLVEVKPQHGPAFEAQFDPAVVKRIGMVTDGSRLNISSRTQALISLPLEELVTTWSRST